MRRSPNAWIAAAAVGLFVATTVPAGAQIPEEFTNLKVLSPDTERRALIDMMRGFSSQLGVRCKHCHVGESTDSLEGYDFASDDKEAKRIARAMIKMTGEINNVHLPEIGRELTVGVRCVTCHHGQPIPDTLERQLMAAFDEGGVEALTGKYAELREELYGRGVLDFSELALLGIATDLARGRQDPAAAGAVLDLNLEYYPDSFYTWMSKGQLATMMGDNDAARSALERAQQIDPDNPQVEQMLDQLER